MTTSKREKTDFTLLLPVYKQGSDLNQHLEETPDDAKAFLALAARYEEAARLCRRVAGAIKESGCEMDIDVEGDTHFIGISGPAEVFAGLVSDKVLEVVDYDNWATDDPWYDPDPDGPDYESDMSWPDEG